MINPYSKEKSGQYKKGEQAELNKMPADIRFACLSVTDSGKGITEEDMKNVFAPFYQGAGL